MGLSTAALLAYHPAHSGSLLCFSILQFGSLSFFFFFFNIKPFVCVYSPHFTAAWVRRREGEGGADNALWNRVQFCLHGKGWRWLLWVDVFRQGKEENPGWRWVVWKRPQHMKDISFSVCIQLMFSQQVNKKKKNKHLASSTDLPFRLKRCSSCSGNFPLAPPSDVWSTFSCYVCSWCFSVIFSFSAFSCWMILLLLSLLFRMHFLLKFLAS